MHIVQAFKKKLILDFFYSRNLLIIINQPTITKITQKAYPFKDQEIPSDIHKPNILKTLLFRIDG